MCAGFTDIDFSGLIRLAFMCVLGVCGSVNNTTCLVSFLLQDSVSLLSKAISDDCNVYLALGIMWRTDTFTHTEAKELLNNTQHLLRIETFPLRLLSVSPPLLLTLGLSLFLSLSYFSILSLLSLLSRRHISRAATKSITSDWLLMVKPAASRDTG